jgi:hypothetical protein
MKTNPLRPNTGIKQGPSFKFQAAPDAENLFEAW